MRTIPIEGIFAVLFVVAVIGWEVSMRRAKRAGMADTHELSAGRPASQSDEAGQLDYDREPYGLSDAFGLVFKPAAWFFSWALRLDDQAAEDAERPSKGRNEGRPLDGPAGVASGRSGRLSGLDERDLRAALAAQTPAAYEAERWADEERPAAPAQADGRPAGAAALIDGPADQRQHTICAIGPGGGKTTLDNAIMLADMTKADKAGRPYQIIVLNPHFSYYHPEQQPTDLRPLKGRFEAYSEYTQIRDALRNLVTEAKRRKGIFNRSEGDDLGHTIVVHIDEWPDIAACMDAGQLTTPAGKRLMAVGEECAFYLTELLRLARKYGLYVVLWSQDARVDTLNFHGGVRAAFMTRVVGRGTDEYDWKALIGAAHERPAYIERGSYYVAGVISGRLIGYVPDELDVAAALRAPAGRYRPIVTPAAPDEAGRPAGREERLAAGRPIASADELDEQAAEPAGLYTAGWVDEAEREAAEDWHERTMINERSGRKFATWLYYYRGGQRSEYKGGGSFDSQVAKALYASLQERLAV